MADDQQPEPQPQPVELGLNLQPVGVNMTVAPLLSDQGQPLVLIGYETPVGTFGIFYTPDAADAFAREIQEKSRKARLMIPPQLAHLGDQALTQIVENGRRARGTG